MAVYGVLTKVITNLTQLFQNSTRLCIVFIYLIHYRVNMHVSLAIHSLDRKNNKLIMLTNPPQHYRNKIFVSHRFAGENHCRHCRCWTRRIIGSEIRVQLATPLPRLGRLSYPARWMSVPSKYHALTALNTNELYTSSMKFIQLKNYQYQKGNIYKYRHIYV